MEQSRFLSFDFFPSFQSKEDYFEKLTTDPQPLGKLLLLYLLFNLLAFLYGVAMGSYHSFAQALAAGIKVALLFSLTLDICFPAFFIVQFILGSKLKLTQMAAVVLSGFFLTSAIMISFLPIGIFFVLTGSNYYFLQLLHIAVFLFAGFFGMKWIIDGLQFSCEKRNIYPKTGVVVFRVWLVIFAIVFIQLAWNLRPFLGDRGKPFEWFRKYEGNFYTAVLYSIRQLTGEEPDKTRNPAAVPRPLSRSTSKPQVDGLDPANIITKEQHGN